MIQLLLENHIDNISIKKIIITAHISDQNNITRYYFLKLAKMKVHINPEYIVIFVSFGSIGSFFRVLQVISVFLSSK